MLNKLFTPLFVAAVSLIAPIASTGCTATVDSDVVLDDPPPPREETVEVRPGFIFVHGNWQRRGGSWDWRPGRYERERPGQAWVEGGWEQRGRGRAWREGHWEARREGVIGVHRN